MRLVVAFVLVACSANPDRPAAGGSGGISSSVAGAGAGGSAAGSAAGGSSAGTPAAVMAGAPAAGQGQGRSAAGSAGAPEGGRAPVLGGHGGVPAVGGFGGVGGYRTLETMGDCDPDVLPAKTSSVYCPTTAELGALGCVNTSSVTRADLQAAQCFISVTGSAPASYACTRLPAEDWGWVCGYGPVWLYGLCEADCMRDREIISPTPQYNLSCPQL